ncbi:MAG: hypothetical protein EOO77_12890 [Oxalobacteraceae bacterium]|nr:MAG: hypothetical protein EOO77_12890 [Oxalobacteraceae bacterium]
MKDKVIDAGEEIKAHPFKTVMMALAAITAAMAVLAFCGSRMPGGMASREVFVAFFGKIKDMLSAIPFPGSGIKAAATARAGVTITPVTIPTKVVGTARSLGWSGPTVNEVCNGSATVVRSAFSTIGVFARQVASFVVKGIPKAFEAGRKFTKQAPVVVHAVTRSKFLGHASYIGLTVAFYGFCLKLALLAAKIVYEICCTAVLIIKSTMILFL